MLKPTPEDPTLTAYMPRKARGFSLLELILATSLTALALVPALRMIRQGMKISGELETRQLTSTYCVSKLEQHLCIAAAAWDVTTITGTFAADGNSGIRYRIVTSDAAIDGGIPDRLMSVSVVVWEDSDNDSVVDDDELFTDMRSKIAKLATYQDAASP